MKRKGLAVLGRWASVSKRLRQRYQRARRATFERLEERWVLSPTIASVANQAVSPGSDYIIPLTSTDTSAVTYTVQTNKSSFFNSATAPNLPTLPIVSAAGDDLTIVTPDGNMTFLLLDGDSIVNSTVTRIENAVNNGYYKNATFYYSSQLTVSGGTQATGSNPLQIDPALQFTEPGILSIVGAGTANMDSNDFSISTQPLSSVANGSATIFGIQTSGASVLKTIADSAANGSGFLNTPIPISSISVTPDDTSAVLLLPVAAGAAGSATINVSASDGSGSPATTSFTVAAAPAVTAVTPNGGPTGGGTSVTITGSGFTGATAVEFGSTAAASFTVNSDGSITAKSPAGSGTVDVTVTTPAGTSALSSLDKFSFDSVPTVTQVSPQTGLGSGGTTVTITGTGFVAGATTVDFGGVAASNVSVGTSSTLSATSPAGSGTVDVTVVTPGGTSAITSGDKFTYEAAPTVTHIAPSSGAGGGGTTVTVTGTGFVTGATTVDFGGVAATSVSVTSSSTLTAVSPAGSGTVNVTATTSSGTSPTSSSDQFSYVAAPTVTAISPNSGAAAGGTSVTITGTNFSGATAVKFGSAAATGVTVNSQGTSITATSPAGTGTVDVTVVTPGGTSATSSNDKFNYIPLVSGVTVSTATVTQANVGTNTFTVTLTYSEAMDESSTPTITFSPDVSDTLTFDSGSWTDSTHYAASYDVASGGASQTSVAVDVSDATSAAGIAQADYTGSSNFAVDTQNPAVLSLTPNLTTLTSANTGSNAFTLTVVYSTAMDTSQGLTSSAQLISFPTSGENPVTGGTLTFNSGSWTNDTTYVAAYNVANEGLSMSNIDVAVQGALDTTDTNTQVPFTKSSVFSINMPASGSLAGLVTFGSAKAGINGVTVRLLSGSTEVSGQSPKQTKPDGSYSFTSLAAGTYTIELIPEPDYTNWSTDTSASSPAGTTSGLPADEIQVVLGAGVNGTSYNFSAKTIQSKMISARLFFASAAPVTVAVASMHTAPTVNLSGSTGASSTATFQPGGSAVAIAPSATITSPGSTTLAGLTATLTNAKDGASEVLAVPSADLTGTNITSSYGGGTLTLSGVADVATYQTVLDGLTYSDTAASLQSGNRSITVTVNDGTATSQAATATVSFSQTQAAPAVTAITPTSGPAAGGTAVTVTGTGFNGATAVDFGNAAATALTVNSATQVTATSPAGSGTVDVTVTAPGGTSPTLSADQFTYLPAPAVSAIDPTSGPTSGGTQVTVSGTSFTGATAVDFGSLAASSFSVDSDTQVTATSPAASAGTVDVTVTTPDGTSPGLSADQFTYLAAPAVSGIMPASGPVAGGTQVTISGTGFSDAAEVDFGSLSASSFAINSDSQITATSPAATPTGTGTVDVTVTTPGGTSQPLSADQFTYAPTVASLDHSSGPAAGGTQVTVTGTGFVSGGTTVNFGSTAATSVTVASSTQLTAASPAGSGTVHVTVGTSAGTSATSTADQFTYGPTVGALNPATGSSLGGTQVVITGTGFTGATAVDFAGVAASGFTINTASQITATSPAGSGAADVTVTTPAGTSPTSSADLFTYQVPTADAVDNVLAQTGNWLS
jgi:cyclophilin family peptidyl-prolyl cis-trans isomerase